MFFFSDEKNKYLFREGTKIIKKPIQEKLLRASKKITDIVNEGDKIKMETFNTLFEKLTIRAIRKKASKTHS